MANLVCKNNSFLTKQIYLRQICHVGQQNLPSRRTFAIKIVRFAMVTAPELAEAPALRRAVALTRTPSKCSALAPLAACKHSAPAPAPARQIGGWVSLPTDIVGLITCRLLAGDGDVVDYICFRAVCFGWRTCTPAPRDPNLRDPRLRPRGWVALCDGDAVRPDDACEIVFFHTRTARRLRVPLPELRRHRIIGFTDGLVILMHKTTTAVRVLHPFTRDVVDFQPLATLYHQAVRHKGSLLDMNAAVCSSAASSADSIAVVVWFPYTDVVLAADPGSDWEVLHRGFYVWCALPFQGRLYATLCCSSEIVQLYPPRRNGPQENSLVVIARAPHSADREVCNFYLVESGGRMLLAVRQPAPYANGAEWNAMDWSRQLVCRLYVVDLNGGQRRKLIQVKNIGDTALFLSRDRCLSVSARDLPSLSSNSIYLSLPSDPIVVHSLGTGLSERLADSCQIHDRTERIRPSVRPFTIVDHLITYCNPRVCGDLIDVSNDIGVQISPKLKNQDKMFHALEISKDILEYRLGDIERYS
uniref:KIB1-4 beta-propeller domain-containing protein n=1 Tax=Aegilops tauschii TaxID=37682 RepID=M8B488_AEGTA